MEEQNRKVLKSYFYGNRWPQIIMLLALPVTIFLGASTRDFGNSSSVFVLMVIIASVWYCIDKFTVSNPKAEELYDSLVKVDVEKFRPISMEKLGLLEENIQKADPINVYGAYLDYDPTIHEIKQNFFEKLFNPLPRLILKVGADNKIRSSLVQITMFYFSKDQIFVYQVDYDICSGDFLEDSTSEYFYTDIDCIRTGERLVTEKKKREIVKKKYEYFQVIVTSGTSTYAISEEPILEHEVMGMRQLVRDCKNEFEEL